MGKLCGMESDFRDRVAENVPGKFYVTQECTDCDLCRDTAPTVFGRNDEKGESYVMKQPETPEELMLTYEALEGCCMEAIFDDGDQFDWDAIPPHSLSDGGSKTDPNEKKSCGCAEKKSSSRTDELHG